MRILPILSLFVLCEAHDFPNKGHLTTTGGARGRGSAGSVHGVHGVHGLQLDAGRLPPGYEARWSMSDHFLMPKWWSKWWSDGISENRISPYLMELVWWNQKIYLFNIWNIWWIFDVPDFPGGLWLSCWVSSAATSLSNALLAALDALP